MKSVTVAALATGLLLLGGCGASDPTGSSEAAGGSADSSGAQAQSTDKKSSSDEMATPAGSYITYDRFSADPAAYGDTAVVLFFHASWCPNCQETEANLNAGSIPDGLTVVKVDYDTANDLRQKYGVTLQHTFVQVDADGDQVAKWNGSVDADDILSQTT